MLDCSLEGIYEDTECLSWVFLHNINPVITFCWINEEHNGKGNYHSPGKNLSMIFLHQKKKHYFNFIIILF